MKICARNLSFGYGGNLLFDQFSADFDTAGAGRPLVILGPSGCGKTTLLKLLGGLLIPGKGRIIYSCGAVQNETVQMTIEGGDSGPLAVTPKTAFMFQEPRLLPWLTVLENISLPLEKDLGREKARERAKHFLSLVFLDDKEGAYPGELSGGQAQRVSMARAFAWSSPALFMDEPFQSLDIPLRISLMDMVLSLLEKGKRLLVAITHEPRDAIYMGGRIIILGKPGEGIVFDRAVDLDSEDRAYGSPAAGELEREIIKALKSQG